MSSLEELRVKIFSDGARLEDLEELNEVPYIKGFTTNPTLMKMAGVSDYYDFLKRALSIVSEKPISFEVISDEFKEMREQALELSGYGDNVYVKIPITNTGGERSRPWMVDLSSRGVNITPTAGMTLKQVEGVSEVLAGGSEAIVSVFAGRIADTGVDPVPIMRKARGLLKDLENAELLWASSRELLNVFQAEDAGCDIITVTPELLAKQKVVGHDLGEFSLDTVKMFYRDAVSSGFKL